MNILIGYVQSLFANIGPFFILLGILIFVHELGHFLVAKFFGVRVETFSLGFGKRLINYKKGDTAYCLSLIPLGGYVKMYGDDPSAEVPADQKQYAFLHKPIAQRFAIVLAGPLMNLFFAIFIFSAIVGMGEDVSGPYLGDIATDSKAYTAGFRSGDKILSINSEETPTWSNVQRLVENSGGKILNVVLERKGEAQPLNIEAAAAYGDNDNIFSSNRQVGQIAGMTQESRSTMLGVNNPQSPAAQAGVPTLNLLTAVNGKKIQYWRELEPMLREAIASDSKTLKLQTRDIEKPATPENLQTFDLKLPEGIAAKADLATAIGLEPAELYIFSVAKKSPAELAGILAHDKVVKVGGKAVSSWNDVLTIVKAFDPTSDALEFTVQRAGVEKVFKVKPEMTTIMSNKGQEEHRFTIGILSGFFPVGADSVYFRITNPIKMVQHGLNETVYWTEFVVMSMVRLIQGEVSAKNLGGVITIGRVASHSFAAGLSTFMRMMGLISINLFLLNLLPIPILDGGHLVFYTIEALRGAPLSMRKMEIAQQVGLMLLMFLMAFAFFNDITNLFSSRW
ncbi:MAG: RIP metalloprotease RseP [Bdellovibrionales bacterium]